MIAYWRQPVPGVWSVRHEAYGRKRGTVTVTLDDGTERSWSVEPGLVVTQEMAEEFAQVALKERDRRLAAALAAQIAEACCGE